MRRILRYLFGYAVIEADAEYAVKIANLLAEYKLSSYDMNVGESRNLTFVLDLSALSSFDGICRKCGCEYTVTAERGLSVILKKHKDRLGLLIGACITIVLLAVSSNYVWGFEFVGNANVENSEIAKVLKQADFGIGTKFSEVDFSQMQNDVLMYTDKLAWISVNMSGTVARVEVTERTHGNETAFTGCANVIATEDGTVELIEEAGGEAIVKPGDYVRKGDLLISGVTVDKNGNLRYEYARGSVKARVTRSFTVSVPRVIVEKTPSGRTDTKNSVKIFEKNINLFINGGSSYEKYDIIEENGQIKMFGVFPIPVILNSVKYAEYTETERELTESEMISSAMSLYTDALNNAIGDGELLETDVSSYYDGEAYVIKCTVICLDEITETVKVEIKES